jgi:cell pole-organizing protein PopZ
MADSNRTGERLLDSIRKAKEGEDAPAGTAAAAAPTHGQARTPAAASKKTAVRKTSAKKAPTKKAPAKQAAPRPAAGRKTTAGEASSRNVTTAAPYPMPGSQRPQPGPFPGQSADEDPYRSKDRTWPD